MFIFIFVYFVDSLIYGSKYESVLYDKKIQEKKTKHQNFKNLFIFANKNIW